MVSIALIRPLVAEICSEHRSNPMETDGYLNYETAQQSPYFNRNECVFSDRELEMLSACQNILLSSDQRKKHRIEQRN
jgi:hypothetical protein